MFQARVTRVTPQPGGAIVTVDAAPAARNDSARYVLEIVIEPDRSLSVPNEAIIESDGKRVVYVKVSEGEYKPRDDRAWPPGRALHRGPAAARRAASRS